MSSFREYLIAQGMKIKDPAAIDHIETDKRNRYLITGAVGTGKTEMARQLCTYRNARYLRIDVFGAANYTPPDIAQIIKDNDVIILDDLGAEKTTDKTQQLLYAVCGAMERGSDIGLIVTTNLSSDKIRSLYGDRIFDRLIGWMVVLGLNKPSFREEKATVIK